MAKNISTTQDGDEFIVSFKDTHNTIVNAMRRIILDEVPTFAIEDVEVVKNESPLYSETVAHRLGLVPLKTDLKSYNFKESCTCGGVGCALCEVKLTLAQKEEGYVFSGSIKSDDPQIVPADMNIPITKLFPGNELELNLKAVLGRGRVHAKWAPAHTYLKEGDKNEVNLVIESFGQLDSKDIYNNAIDILVEKINELESNL
ncbi:MAG: DNA-directed RNA polymerase subunit D [Nanoarchaeota archaeon]|nr:DNA-directed RNA polymerase subunit D [Nanoarchaeota archaeon]MEC8339123.1 DNA-directed RNA polymerase subunit D [Nanoarchaeota archaeon]